MGINCSIDKEKDQDKDGPGNHVETDTQKVQRVPSKLVKQPHPRQSATSITNRKRSIFPPSGRDHNKVRKFDNDDKETSLANMEDKSTQEGKQPAATSRPHFVDAMDKAIDSQVQGVPDCENGDPDALLAETPTEDFHGMRKRFLKREQALGFDWDCTQTASELEKQAAEIVRRNVQRDKDEIYDKAKPRKGYAGQEHKRVYGDHFLSNREFIEKTRLFEIAKKMPKGAHLHIHFNANLKPDFLINVAKEAERMFISSDIPLLTRDDLDRCRIQFNIRAAGNVIRNRPENDNAETDVFKDNYGSTRDDMSFGRFRELFKKNFGSQGLEVDSWLCSKLVFDETEAHNLCQSADGAWEKFNTRTQMMKGLFNYETAYRKYTRACLWEFVDDNIQYAEIRPNFMMTNQIWTDDGVSKYNNKEIIKIIIDEYRQFNAELQKRNQRRYFKGLKIIYCTPRSFSQDLVAKALNECFHFKLGSKKEDLDPADGQENGVPAPVPRKEEQGATAVLGGDVTDDEISQFIAGFDLVGEESKGKPLQAFAKELIAFRRRCIRNKLDIPFLFHCGETLDIGTDTDGNLVDALLLGAKRIGHGFALSRHPYIMEQMKKKGICLELCPISNEILGLTPRVGGHSMYNLLANDVHCTVSTDNGTLFKSTLSHDFYQVFAGKANMTLHGWRQLIEWSIEHACLDKSEKKELHHEWLRMWKNFCQWIVDKENDPHNNWKEIRYPPELPESPERAKLS